MYDLGTKLKKTIHFSVVVIILSLVIMVICLLMLKYAVEGEHNMPFELSQLIVVSTAEGIENSQNENIWNFDLRQNNDVCIYIEKNKNYKDTEIIKKITVNNIRIESEPKKGKIITYRPSENETNLYEYADNYIVNNELVYLGSETTNVKNLEIANQGGVIIFRFCNKDLRYIYF